MTRSETASFCQKFNLIIWEDTTNQDLTYVRNRLRLELVTYLKQHFNPQVEIALAQTAELLQADVEYLEAQASQLRATIQHPTDPAINRKLLGSIPLALQRRVVRQFLAQQLSYAPTFAHIDKFIALTLSPNRSRSAPFPGDVMAEVQGSWIYLHPNQ